MKILNIFILVLGFLFVLIGYGYSSSIEELESLPYLAWSPKPDKNMSGVDKYDKTKAFDGYNLYMDRSTHAYLIDMAGHVVYSWRLPPVMHGWEYVRLLKDGSILGVSRGGGFVKLDKNSRLIWKTRIKANHDIEILPDGTYLVQAAEIPVIYENRCVHFSSIVHVATDGKILDKWSTFDHLIELQKLHAPSYLDTMYKDDMDEQLLHYIARLTKKGDLLWPYYDNGYMKDMCSARQGCYDYYHLNSIQLLPQTALGLKDKRFQKGNWLIGSRHTDLIFILDKDTRHVVWSWGPGILDWPHMPRMLDSGNILVYDNGYHRTFSRLVIVNPVTNKIVWEYKANPPESFHSSTEGSSQLLGNGNIFICESEKGHAFEITPGGKIVWEFYNPKVDDDGRRQTIARMIRIPKEEVSGWLNKCYH